MSDSPTKKRKANDGRATVTDSSHSGGGGFLSSWLGYFTGRRHDTTSTTCGGENLTHKMDRMEKIMVRMEEKLTTVSSLERRCEKLEDKCSSLEHMLKTKIEQDDCKFDSLVKQHEYNNMLVKNQSWKYSVPVYSEEHYENIGYNEDVAHYLAESSRPLKEITEIIRRGEFPDVYSDDRKGISYSDARKGFNLNWAEEDPILDDDAIINMSPHWEEFTDALEQFTPAFGVLSDSCETFFSLGNVQLPDNVPELLKYALMHKPFKELKLVNKANVGGDMGMTIANIIDIIDSNKYLRKLTIGNNRIQLSQMKSICSAVRRGSIVELDLYNCFENGLGDDMITSLLTNGGSKLKRLGLDSNGITSSEITTLANVLATNPPLQELDLSNNGLSVDCVDLLANALRSNRSLKNLNLGGNTISDAGKESFRRVLNNDINLNLIADSNHSCVLEGVGFFSWNMRGFWRDGAWHEAPESFNRARKIYRLLSARNNQSMSTSNVQYFDKIDVKILPDMLKAVQRYAIVIHPCDSVKALSIVYEVMRKWDKVFPLYTKER